MNESNLPSCLITGAANGNGRAIADRFLAEGYYCILLDKQEDFIERSSTLWPLHLNSFTSVIYDLSCLLNIDDIANCVATCTSGLDVLINNAGITRPTYNRLCSLEDWNLTINVNLAAPLFLSQSLVDRDLLRRGSSIVNITSLAAEQGFPGNPAYIASKGGLKQLSKSLAIDYAPYGIRCNCVGPGYVKTNMTSASWQNPELRDIRSSRMISDRWAEPNDIANACFFLASKDSTYITGQDIYVDGGWLAKGL